MAKSIKDLPRDIFGITMFATAKARLKEFTHFIAVLGELGCCHPQVSVIDLLAYVRLGILSPQSASYFMAGRASFLQVFKLESFIKVAGDLVNQPGKLFKSIQLWQKQNVSAPESTFLFPLAELDSNESFEGEKERYKDLKYQDLQLL